LIKEEKVNRTFIIKKINIGDTFFITYVVFLPIFQKYAKISLKEKVRREAEKLMCIEAALRNIQLNLIQLGHSFTSQIHICVG